MLDNNNLQQPSNTDHFSYKTISCWTDLLGFGAHLNAMNWKLSNDTNLIMIKRLINQATLVTETASSMEQGMFINDAITRTLYHEYYSGTRKTMTAYWLDLCISCHCKILQNEIFFGFPGIRTIICEGEIFAYKSLVESNFKKPFNQTDSILPTLNTALSKCYYADQIGSKGGVKKNSIYIEESILDHMITNHESKLLDNIFFPRGHNLLSPVSKYFSIDNLFFFKDESSRIKAEDSFCRIPWMKLGERIKLEMGSLSYTLIEIEAYSPQSDFSLFWYNTNTGSPHGITFLEFSKEEFLIPQPNYVVQNSKEDLLVQELFSAAE